MGTPSYMDREVRDWEHCGLAERHCHRREDEDMDSKAGMPHRARQLAVECHRSVEDAAVARWLVGTRFYPAASRPS